MQSLGQYGSAARAQRMSQSMRFLTNKIHKAGLLHVDMV